MNRESVFIVFAAALFVMFSSCTDEALRRGYVRRIARHSGTGTDSSRVEEMPEGQPEEESPRELEPHLYLAGVRYPDAYDWQRDTEYGAVDCQLFLMRDDELLLELPVGSADEVASDQDMHHIVQGHLFTDYSTSDETIVKKDGEKCFSFSGRDMLRGIFLKDDKLYTLWEHRQGSGFVYRCDDKTLLSSGGELLTDLSFHQGRLSFAFRAFDGQIHLVTDAVSRVLPELGDRGDDLLFACYESSLFRLRKDGNNIYVYKNGEKVGDMPGAAKEGILFKNLLYDRSNVFAVGEKVLSDSTRTTYSYRNGYLNGVFSGKSCVCSACHDDRLWILCQDGITGVCSVMGDGSETLLDPKWRPFSSRSTLMSEAVLRIALCSETGPAVWCSDGSIKTFSFNGFIDSMEMLME